MTEETAPAKDQQAPTGAETEAAFIVDPATDEVLRLHLDQFEGPFEVLLYLVKVQEIDIFDIPVAQITEQYLRFLEMMRDENLEVTGEFLVMAATLIQIKSKLLLPPDDSEDEEEEMEEEDPRLELVEKLLEYRRYKDVAERLERLEAARSDVFARRVPPTIEVEEEEEEVLEVSLYDLVDAFKAYLKFFEDETYHQIQAVQCSVDDKVEEIERRLVEAGSVCWTDLLADCRSRVELVCCFLAILELCRMGRIRAHQHANFDEIRIFPVEASAEA